MQNADDGATTIQLRMKEWQKRQIAARAAEVGMSPSDFLRWLGLNAEVVRPRIEMPEPEQPKEPARKRPRRIPEEGPSEGPNIEKLLATEFEVAEPDWDALGAKVGEVWGQVLKAIDNEGAIIDSERMGRAFMQACQKCGAKFSISLQAAATRWLWESEYAALIEGVERSI